MNFLRRRLLGEPHLSDLKGGNTMSNNADRDEYPIKDPNCANEYRHLPDGGYEGRNGDTVWGTRRNPTTDEWETYSNK